MSGMFGLLNLDKPAGITSRDAVNQVHRIVRPLKCGHAGTLDPMATGVLLVCVGPATRLVDLLHELPKSYRSRFELAATSDTDDITGTVSRRSVASPPSIAALQSALSAQTGAIQQVPPAYSAVHHGGQRAYRLARAGQTPRLNPRTVRVHRLTLLRYDWPDVEVEVECGSGTYIRSLARDIGEHLGCGGLMTELRRTAIGDFHASEAVPPEFADQDEVRSRLLSPLRIVSSLPLVRCSDDEERFVRQGRAIRVPRGSLVAASEPAPGGTADRVALLTSDGGHLLALGQSTVDRDRLVIQPRTVLTAR